ncbi:hypothetical protein SBOR_3983 [Sclerotinia borealis F-4128]|uniref:DUF7029 domain-containing protein n=1 Tax=Sclerotinia borealis (strain F-4128) TaxID=1432307 RepID=W9CM80_SCLBF|nr:hypothetical protein SBOR_3983 [Sclerotinia borealis F-4128]
MKYRLPAVTLEDIELNAKNIVCSESTIIIDFPSSRLLAEAEREWKDLTEFLLIFSHAGCNSEGARAPYLVSKVDFEPEFYIAILSVRRLEWSDAYDTMEVNFGMGQYDSSCIRVHGDLRKGTTPIVSVTYSESVSYPSAPSATPTADNPVRNIAYSVPAGGLNLGTFTAATDGQDGTSSINCADCSVEGSIEITQGVFTISIYSQAANFVNHGYFDAVANGLGAHIEIDTSIIPDVATIGPMWRPIVYGSIDVSSNMNFTYGFSAAVPTDSSIHLNIGNRKGSIYAGAFLDLPALSVSISQVSSVDKSCDPAFDSPSLSKTDIFPSLTNIVPYAAIAVGLEAGVHLDVPDLNVQEDFGPTITLAGTSITLPTACLKFDAEVKEFVSTTPTGAAADSTKSPNTGGKLALPLGLDGGIDSWYWTAGMLGGVFFGCDGIVMSFLMP